MYLCLLLYRKLLKYNIVNVYVMFWVGKQKGSEAIGKRATVRDGEIVGNANAVSIP